jgi:hypothetical protein
MEAVDLAVQFGGVFIGAFLAIGLENYRQARHTRKWVREHLRQLAGWLRPALERDSLLVSMNQLFASLDRWLAAKRPEDMDEEAWSLVATRFNSLMLDFGHLLRGEALAVIPRELGPVITRVEHAMTMLANDMARLTACQERDILPLVYQRQVPLDDVDARRVRDYRVLLGDLSTTWDDLVKAAGEMLDGVDRL